MIEDTPELLLIWGLSDPRIAELSNELNRNSFTVIWVWFVANPHGLVSERKHSITHHHHTFTSLFVHHLFFIYTVPVEKWHQATLLLNKDEFFQNQIASNFVSTVTKTLLSTIARNPNKHPLNIILGPYVRIVTRLTRSARLTHPPWSLNLFIYLPFHLPFSSIVWGSLCIDGRKLLAIGKEE